MPKLELVGQAPAGNDLEYAPELALASGRVRIVPSDEPWVTYQDLSDFAPERRALPNRILESSDGRLLLSLSEQDATVFAVAHQASKTLVRLRNLPVTDHDSIHLSPGGAFALVDELTASGSGAPRTGKLAVYDANTGALVKEVLAPRIVGLFFRGISPTGVVLYQSMGSDELVDLGMRFAPVAVLRSPRADLVALPVFFADR